MTELKTLKDFESNDESVDLLLEVRQEAVKWVKYDRLNYEIRWGSAAHQIINNWIKRFNLTEKELSGVKE